MTWQDTPCQPCHGQGWIAVEDAPGMPASHWEPCPFCHGTAHAGWLDEKKASRVDHQTKKRRVLLALTIGWVFCYGLPPIQMARATYGDSWAWTFLVWVLAGAALVFAWVITPSSRSANRASRHAPGFNTNREAAALGLFGAALAARHWYDQSHRHEQAAAPPPPPDQQSSWPAGPQVRYPTAGESVAWNRYRSEGY